MSWLPSWHREAARREADAVFPARDVHIREGDRGKCLAALKVLPLKLSATTEAAWTH